MLDIVTAHEPALRLAAFLGVFALVAGWETLQPRRARRFPRRQSCPHNLGLLVVDGVLHDAPAKVGTAGPGRSARSPRPPAANGDR